MIHHVSIPAGDPQHVVQVLAESMGSLSAFPDYNATASAQAAANAKPGMRHIPPRDIPVPSNEVSLAEQAIIGAPYGRIFNAHPKDAEQWKALANNVADLQVKGIPALALKLGVTITPTTIAGAKCYIVEAKNLPPAQQKSPFGSRSWRRLCLQFGPFGHARGDFTGRIRRL